MVSVPVVSRVACYARVSTEDQAERQTVDAQTSFLRRYCELHELPVHAVYIDDGVSGTVPLEDRPEGKRLLDDAAAGAFSIVLVYKVDRLGRTLKTLIGAHDRLEAAGVAIRSGTEPFDTTNAVGKFVFSLLASVAELDRASTLERMTRGRDRVAGHGRYTGGPVPYGFELDDEKRLVPSTRVIEQLDMTEADLVADLFRRVASSESTMNAESKRLTSLGVPRLRRYAPNLKKGGVARVIERSGVWGISTIGAIIHNPLYKGAGTIKSRFGTVARPSAALVDDDTWQRAQQMTLKNRDMSRRTTDTEYLLRGLVKCGSCGLAYGGGLNRGVQKYRCNSKSGQLSRHPERCPAGQVDAARLEAKVWAEVKAFVADPSEYIRTAQQQHREWMADASRIEAQKRGLAAELAGKERERERVLDLFRRGRITVAECDRDLEKVGEEARTIREQLDALRARLEMAAAHESYLADVGAMMATTVAQIDVIERTNDRAAMRQTIELLVPSIEIMTDVIGTGQRGQRVTRSSVKLRLAFGRERAAVSITDTC